MKFGTGVVVGKFDPPHRGHGLLIETALAQCDEVTVICCVKPTDCVPGELRGAWLREMHPAATIMVIDDIWDPHDTNVWAENTIRFLGRAPDAAFTSEDYGEPYARLMGSAHVSVDRHRVRMPCASREIKRNPFAHWHCLDPPARAFYALRVCVVGAESTGTTTLAEALATHYDTVWVPEYGREYWAMKTSSVVHHDAGEGAGATLSSQPLRWTSDELVHIAAVQNEREERLAREANRVLICDTNAFATFLWHRRYVGHDDVVMPHARCDLYLLTGDEIPFVQDGFRDGEHIRHEMHRWFEEALRAQPVPWLLLRGSPEERLGAATAAVDRMLMPR